MNIQEFRELHEYEQEELIFNKGVFLGNYVQENLICDVYQLVNFYVTFSYVLSTHERAIITVFNNPGNLPLLDDIDLSGVI